MIEVRDRKSKLLLMGIALCVVFILFFILNKLFPLYADDWSYSFIYGTDSVRIGSLGDIFVSQYNHYLMWGGRSVVHFIAQLLLMMPPWWMDIFNTLAYIAFIHVLYLIVNKQNGINPIVYLLLAVSVFLFQPAFYAAAVWKTGSANYLWGTLLIVLFILPYYSYYRSEETKDGWGKAFLFFIVGILAGWTNENMGVALVFYTVATLLLFRYEKMAIPKWAVFGLIGVIIGCGVMLLAPGNYIRLEAIKAIYAEQGLSQSEVLQQGLKNMWRFTRRYVLPLTGVYALLLFVYYKYPKENANRQSVTRSSLLFIISGVVAFLAMIASPAFPQRALFGLIILFIIGIGIVCTNIDIKAKPLKYLSIVCMLVLVGMFAVRYYKDVKRVGAASDIWEEREQLVREQKDKGIDTIVFTKRIDVSDKYFIHDLTTDPQGWENEAYARYHSIDWVKLAPNTEDLEQNKK